MTFEWDYEKADSNRSKHGIDFEEASSVFDDYFYVDFYDPNTQTMNTASLSLANRINSGY